jgi:Flp pilus assembly protein TadG
MRVSAARIAEASAREHGAVLVLFALFAPVAILFFAFVVDIGNAWWHKNHLQLQADAAALAAAQGFEPCSNAAITAAAQQYGGVTSGAYNQQVGGTAPANIFQLINSQTFYNQPNPVDTTTNTAAPCTSNMIDVKMTETNLPLFTQSLLSAFGLGPWQYINAQARVQIETMTTSGPGDIPVAVNDTVFNSAETYFINESSGAVLGAMPLTAQGTSNGLALWSNAASPYALTVPTGATSDVGVRIALSGTNNLTGNMTSDCATAGVVCYDSSGSTAALLDVHGWSTSGTGSVSAPIPRQVVMTPGTCNDQYYTNAAANCTDGIQATIDFGASPNLTGVTVSAVAGGTSTTLSCTTAQPSVCTGTVPITAASGRNQVNITVKQGKNTVTLPNVQSTYAAAINGNAGPIQTLTLSENGVGDTSSLQQGTTHSLVVTMAITGSIAAAQSINDTPFVMRFSGTGSQNQSVNCTAVNGGTTYADMLASGCAGTFQVNQTLTCPDNNTPIDCVSVATGNKENEVAKGLNERILGSAKPTICTNPNHWSSFPNLPANDPRVVTAFITPYGSFTGNGGSIQYPIQYFAAFYITGWADSKGNGFNNPCQGNGDDTAQPATIVGHFISYVKTLGNGSGGNTSCVANSLNECVTVLTR